MRVLLVIFLFAAAVAVLYVAIAAIATKAAKATNKELNAKEADLDRANVARVESDKALAKAERALRTIANGAGAPELEAQIALDEIVNYRAKELG